MVVALLVFADFLNGIATVAGVQLRDQLGQQVGVLGSFLDGGQAGARGLALPRRAVAILDGGIVFGVRV